MLDNGNFILASRDSSVNLWESFKQPRDTILPTQTMEVDSVLYSRETKNTFSKGRFRLRLLQDGNLVLNIVAFPSLFEVQYDAYYWSDTTADINQTNAGYKVVFNESGYIYVMRRNGDLKNLLGQNINPDNDLYYRATLDFDGVFTQYSHPRTSSGENSSWSIVSSVPDNICTSIGGVLGSGACGYNSYCTLTEERRPNCKCPPAYSTVDPNNSFSGCKPNFIQGCQGEEWRNPDNSFEFQTLQDIDWPTSDYEKLDLYREQDCRNACLSDCLCAVAIVRAGTCWKKKLPLSNGRYSSSMNGKALIKVRKDSFTTPPNSCRPISEKKKDRSTLILVGSLLLGSSVLVNLLMLARSCLFFFKDYKKGEKINQESSVMISNLRSFTYKELEEATSSFKEELGKGAFGIVYKGVIREMGSRTYVAVKKLDKVVQEGEKEFRAEVNVIGRTHHKNLVQLLGFCEEGQHRLLVYEYMSNSNLAKHLFEISKPGWNQRIQIATCIARGLMYLHEECNTQIIHCDIKPQNILLDDSFTARISDFGLAKLLMNDQTRIRTGVRGTKGYVAPEWFKNTPVTVKVDVYSFGVMLLEIICCRKSIDLELEEEKSILTDWAYDCYREGKLPDLVENDEDAINDKRLKGLVMIALLCIQEEPSLRPSMKKVVQMLEGVVEVSVPPCPYSLSIISGDHSQSL